MIAARATIIQFRWWLARRIGELAWWVCPEPYKSRQRAAWDATKDDYLAEIGRRIAAEGECGDV